MGPRVRRRVSPVRTLGSHLRRSSVQVGRFLAQCGAIIALSAALAASARADSVTLFAVDDGWYAQQVGSSGTPFAYLNNNPTALSNYVTGNVADFLFVVSRSYFVFDLSSIEGTVVSATFSAYNPSATTDFADGYRSTDASETLALFDVTTNLSTLTTWVGNNATTAAMWQDLGTGTIYGSQGVSAVDNGELVNVVLVSDAIAAIDAATGLFALGGSITTLDSLFDRSEFVFGNTNPTFVPRLMLEVIPSVATPEPATLALLGLGLGLGLATRRRNR